MAKVQLQFGKSPPNWPNILRWFGLFCAIILPCFSLAAISGHQTPSDFLVLDFARSMSVLTYGFWLLQASYFLAATGLVLARRPVGLFLLVFGFIYAGMILNALFIAAYVIASWELVLATIVLVAWSIWRLLRINASVTVDEIQKIAQAIIHQEGNPMLLAHGDPAGHASLNAALNGKSSVFATFIEFAGAVCVVLLGAGIALPFAIVGNLSETGLAPWCVWGLAVFVFLAGRGSINKWLLQMRAVKSLNNKIGT